MEENIYLYAMRMVLALFFSFILVYGYHRSFCIETGKTESWFHGKDFTAVWIDPIVFPSALPVYGLMYWLIYRNRYGGLVLVNYIIDVILFLSIYFCMLLLILPLLRKYFAAKTCAVLWLVPVFVFYDPSKFYAAFQLPPVKVIYISGAILRNFFFIWLVGFAIIFIIQCISHILFAVKLKKCSEDITDIEILSVWKQTKEKIGITLPVRLKYSYAAKTPLSIGMFQKRIITYLPRKDYSAFEAELIFCHELRHIQRRDTHTKFFLKFCIALGWFHPFIWVAVKKAEDDLELSCDEIVLLDADPEQCRSYAGILLSSAGAVKGYTTCLSNSAKTLRYRLKAVMSGKKKRKGLLLLFLIMFFSYISVGNFAFTTERGTIRDFLHQDTVPVQAASVVSADGKEISIKDTERISRILSELTLERISFDPQIFESGTELYAEESGRNRVYVVQGEYLTVYDKDTGRRECFYIRDKEEKKQIIE